MAVNLGFRQTDLYRDFYLKKTDCCNINESVLLETRLLPSFENFHSSLVLQPNFVCRPMIFPMALKILQYMSKLLMPNIWHLQYFF